MDFRSSAPDWTIERTLSEQPAAIPVLLAHRLACVGCYMTPFCTLEDVITTYALPREQLLAELHQAIDTARAPAVRPARTGQLADAMPASSRSQKQPQEGRPMQTIDVRTIAPRERHPLIFATFDALRAGEAFLLVNDHDPKPLYYQFSAERQGQFSWEYLEQGPETWRVRIGKPVSAM
jgi:hybrid cluster-associated redox disulfide protein